jgi:hypothetical protein
MFGGLTGIIKKIKDMDNTLTIIVIGLYTIVYLIVFLIQKSQIDKQKEVVNSMKTFIEIFDIKKVENFVSMSENIAKREIEIEKKELEYLGAMKFAKAIKEYMEENGIDNEKQEFIYKFNEMSSAIETILKEMNEKEMNEFINQNLPLNKENFEYLNHRSS